MNIIKMNLLIIFTVFIQLDVRFILFSLVTWNINQITLTNNTDLKVSIEHSLFALVKSIINNLEYEKCLS